MAFECTEKRAEDTRQHGIQVEDAAATMKMGPSATISCAPRSRTRKADPTPGPETGVHQPGSTGPSAVITAPFQQPSVDAHPGPETGVHGKAPTVRGGAIGMRNDVAAKEDFRMHGVLATADQALRPNAPAGPLGHAWRAAKQDPTPGPETGVAPKLGTGPSAVITAPFVHKHQHQHWWWWWWWW